MTYNRNFDNELKLAPGLDALSKLEAMRTGPKVPEFYPETKNFIYNSAGNRSFKMFSHNLPILIVTHPLTGLPLWERAYLCPYCVLTKSLNIYHHKFNCNLDHQDSFVSLIKEGMPPTITLTLTGSLGSLLLKNQRIKALDVGLKEGEYENQFELNWKDLRHRQLIYNDLNNLEITCHGHNRIKGDSLDREGTIGAALLLSLNRSNSVWIDD